MKNLPLITISLILINVLVFIVVGVIGIHAPDISLKDSEICVLLEAPECITSLNDLQRYNKNLRYFLWKNQKDLWDKYEGIIKREYSKDISDCMIRNFSKGGSINSDYCFTYIVISKNRECIIEKAPKCLSFSNLIYYKYGFVSLAVKEGKRPYSLVTSMFLHANALHLISNMLYLYLFGVGVEFFLGKKKTILLYFLSGFTAALFALLLSPSWIPAIGASGAIMGLGGAFFIILSLRKYAIVDPLSNFLNRFIKFLTKKSIEEFYIYFPPLYFIIIISFEIISSMFDLNPGIGHIYHSGGFIGGVILGLLMKENVIVRNVSGY